MSTEIPSLFLTNVPKLTFFFNERGRSAYLEDIWYSYGSTAFPVLETPLHLFAYLMIRRDARKQFMGILLKNNHLRPTDISVDDVLQMYNE